MALTEAEELELLTLEAQASVKAPPKAGWFAAGARAGGETFLNNLFELPDAIGTAALNSPGFAPFKSFLEKSGQEVPSFGDKVLPMPDANDLFATAQMTGENIAGFVTGDVEDLKEKGRFSKAQANQQQISEQNRLEHPFDTQVGELGGDAATIALGRLPVREAWVKAAPVVLEKAKQIIPQSIKNFGKDPGMARWLTDIFKSGKVSALARAAGRSTEAGIEGYALGVLNDQDPNELAMWAAGTQAAGSAALGAADEAFRGGFNRLFAGGAKGLTPWGIGLNLAAAAASITSIWHIAKDVVPGGKDYILQSIEAAYEKVTLGLIAASLAGLGGMGRVTGRRMEDLPRFMDALTAVPRNMVFGTIREALEEEEKGNPEPAVVLDNLNDPSFFGEDAGKFIYKGIEKGDAELTELITQAKEKYPEFKEKVEAKTNQGLGAVKDLFQ